MLNKVSQLSMPPVLPQLPEKWVLNEKVPLKESEESLRYFRPVGISNRQLGIFNTYNSVIVYANSCTSTCLEIMAALSLNRVITSFTQDGMTHLIVFDTTVYTV